MVDPARLTGRSAPAIVRVQTIAADSVLLDPTSSVRIPGGRKRITFSFAGLSLSVPERVRFRYRLENFDHEWSIPGAGREAVYTNLGPGSYRFRVVASNADGVWSEDEAGVPFAVDPLFWQTWWFRMGIVVAFVMACIALYRIRLLAVTRRLNGRFEERLAERTRIAQELHDTLLQGFLSASMQVHVATDKLPENSPGRPVLIRALDLMRQVIDEGRNAVRGLRATRSASLDLEHAFSRIQEEMASFDQDSGSVAFQIVIEGEERPAPPRTPRRGLSDRPGSRDQCVPPRQSEKHRTRIEILEATPASGAGRRARDRARDRTSRTRRTLGSHGYAREGGPDRRATVRFEQRRGRYGD